MHGGHEPEVRDACGDGVGISDKDVGQENCARGYSSDLDGETYALQVAVHDIGSVKILQSFGGVR
jgi:hypothetical protein